MDESIVETEADLASNLVEDGGADEGMMLISCEEMVGDPGSEEGRPSRSRREAEAGGSTKGCSSIA